MSNFILVLLLLLLVHVFFTLHHHVIQFNLIEIKRLCKLSAGFSHLFQNGEKL